jgi:hypothetical protein
MRFFFLPILFKKQILPNGWRCSNTPIKNLAFHHSKVIGILYFALDGELKDLFGGTPSFDLHSI